MKKIIIFLLIVLCLSGCSTSINYEFNEKIINSKIDSRFTLKEFNEKTNVHNDNVTDNDVYNTLMELKDSIIFRAFTNKEDNYKEDIFKKENDSYLLSYSYQYDYENFKDNYFFNSCFDNFEYNEDESYYNVKITGNYTCDMGVILKISAKNGIEKSNSIDINNNIHSWNLYEKDNKIVFSIRKVKEDTSNNGISTIRIVVFIVLILLTIASFGIIFIVKKNN